MNKTLYKIENDGTVRTKVFTDCGPDSTITYPWGMYKQLGWIDEDAYQAVKHLIPIIEAKAAVEKRTLPSEFIAQMETMREVDVKKAADAKAITVAPVATEKKTRKKRGMKNVE